MDMSLLIIVVVCCVVAAIAVAVGFYFLAQFLFPDHTEMQERLMVYKSRHDLDARKQLGQDIDIDQYFKSSSFQNQRYENLLKNNAYISWLKQHLNQSGSKTKVDRFIILFQVLPSIIVILLSTIKPAFLLGLAATIFLPPFALRFKANKRMDKLLFQLPAALNLITTALRAGHSFQSAMGLVVSEMSDPIGTEFRMLVTDANMGIPIKDSLSKLVEQLQLPDVRMFAVSVAVQREAGGNLAEVLDNLGKTVRSRLQLKGQISALTAQSRLTGYLVGALPVICLIILTFVQYDYVSFFYENLFGNIALCIMAIWMGIGVLIIRKIVDIEL